MELISLEELKAVARGGPPVGVSDVPVDAGEDITPRTLAIRVEDTSMRCVGRESLEPGDTILFAPEAALEPGCVVLAVVDDEALIRKYRPLGRGTCGHEFTLVPLNEDFPTIQSSRHNGSEIVGRAIRHIRKM